jgi:hypothetical protein
MNKYETRRLNMLIRVSGFATAHANDFPAASFGNQLFAAVNAAIAGLESHAAVQVSGTARQSTASKAMARANLAETLEVINQTAKAMAIDMPGLEDKFRLPRYMTDNALLHTSRAFLADAAPLKTEFIKYALPVSFLEDLQAEVQAFEEAILTKNSTKSTKLTATVSIDEELAKGMKAVQQLQAVIKNKYRDNPVILAEWTSASHVERSSSSGKAKPDAPSGESPKPQTPPNPNP